MKVAVLGAGISGLAAGWQLQQKGHTPTIFEAGAEPGGKIRSKRVDGYLLELGPNAIQRSRGSLDTALDALGLGAARLDATAAGRNRFICLDGRPEPLPMSPGALFKTRLLSGKAKWRLFREPFVAPNPDDESVAAFFARRLGPEVVTWIIDPFVSGVYAGDPEQLSVSAAFPALKALAREGGSLFRGGLKAWRRKRKSAARQTRGEPRKRGMFSFREGLQEIPAALARALGDSLCLNSPVTELQISGDGWQVNGEAYEAVVSTLPVTDWGAINGGAFPAAQVDYAKMAVVHLAYPAEAVSGRTDGFGMLIPSIEQRAILGVLYNSSLFEGRAPEGQQLFTIFIGGQRHKGPLPAADELLRTAARETEDLLQIAAGVQPAFSQVHVWEQAIPQYGFGHPDFVRQLQAFEARQPNWAFAGNYRQGISVADAFESGIDAADRLAGRLQ